MPQAFAQGEPPGTSAVAVIGTERITFAQLPASVRTDLTELERRKAQRLNQLELDYRRARQALIERRAQDFMDSEILRREAQARKTTVEQLRGEARHPDAPEAEIRDFYEQHKAQINQPFEAVRSAIAVRLTQQAAESSWQAYLGELRSKYAAHLAVAPLREDVAPSGPARGPKDAPVTIIEFADFQCPYCGRMEPVLKRVLERYPADVRLVYRHLPLTDIHPNAMPAAIASVCAEQQGRFWEMHDALFANQAALSLPELTKTAERLQLKKDAFETCMGGQQATAAVKADAEAGLGAGVDGTPGLFVNGRFFNGTMSYERLVEVVEDELWRRGRSTVQAADIARAPQGS